MVNPFYNATGTPATGSFGASAPQRSEFSLIAAGFALLPGTLTANKAVIINSGGTAMTLTVGGLALAGNLITTGAFATTLVAGADISLTLPIVSGLTIATLTGTETLSNKTFGSNVALGTPVSGVATNLTGTAAGLTAGNVTTNANLTGVISSSGNVTSITSQTGTGSVFVVQGSPTLTTPVLGVATATTINKVTITAPATTATLTIGEASTLSIAAGKVVTVSNTLTFTGTDSSSVAFGTGGTVLYNGGALGTPASGTATNITGLPEGGLSLTDITTNNATAGRHGFLPKLSGIATDVLNGQGAFVAGSTDFSEIASHTVSGTEATVSFTGIDNEDLLIVVIGIVGDVASQTLRMKVSINGGSTYTTTGVSVADSSSVTTSAMYYTIPAVGAKVGYLSFVAGAPTATAPGINSTGITAGFGSAVTGGNFNAGAQINAIQFLPSSGNFTAGTITVYGR